MRMISEFVEKLIKRLEAQPTEQFVGIYGNHELVSTVIECCMECVNQLAEEYKDVPDTNVGKWIPVGEALPEVSGEYYTYVYYDGHYMYSIDEIDCDGMIKNWNCASDYQIIAWKPIMPY